MYDCSLTVLDVFLSHSPADAGAAAEIAAALERAAEAKVHLLAGCLRPGETVVDGCEQAEFAGAVILLLSRDSVPARGGRAAWEPVLAHLAQPRPPLACVLLRECAYPPLLRRHNFFPWDGAGRALVRWAVGLHPPMEERGLAPAPIHGFAGREAELAWLWSDLADQPGAAILAGDAGAGKTSLAQEFAYRAAEYFRSIQWVDCEDRFAASVASEAASAGDHRRLIVFDSAASAHAPVEGVNASVLITARHAGGRRLEAVPGRAPDLAAEGPELCLWQAMSTCRRNGCRLDLAAEIAGLSTGALCDALVARRVVAPLDRGGTMYRLLAKAPGADAYRRRHAEVVSSSPKLAAEWESAFRWADANDWELARLVAGRAIGHLRASGRIAEEMEWLEAEQAAADRHGDAATASSCAWELSWFRPVPGGPLLRSAPGEQLTLF